MKAVQSSRNVFFRYCASTTQLFFMISARLTTGIKAINFPIATCRRKCETLENRNLFNGFLHINITNCTAPCFSGDLVGVVFGPCCSLFLPFDFSRDKTITKQDIQSAKSGSFLSEGGREAGCWTCARGGSHSARGNRCPPPSHALETNPPNSAPAACSANQPKNRQDWIFCRSRIIPD